ncbi:MAG TPA: MFS transporter [Candidatus Limnocylindrales bacterium]|nr:MFS transporter [Candidatus Limnocylindrales bacterium]
MSAAGLPIEPARRLGGLAALTPSGRAIVPLSWALYDFANTIFSFAVVSGAIGIWLTDPAQFGERDGNVLLSVSILVSVGLNAIVSPILGAISDRGGRRLPYLLFFTALCVIPTAFIGATGAVVGLVLFIVANFAYQAALIYYDATLRVVSYPATRGTLSGIGVAIGYMGTIFVGLLIFALELLFEMPVALRFVLSAGLYGLFAVPIFLVVRESSAPGVRRMTGREVAASFTQLRRTIAHARSVPGLGRFLLGRFFYSDAVNTVIVVMSVVALEAKGLSPMYTNLLLLSLTVVAVVASVGWGRLVDRVGPKRALVTVLLSWAVGLTIGAVSLGIDGAFGLGLFAFAGAILGSGLGGVQVADRVLLMRLAPPERLGEFFGLYGLVGKGSQVIGQILYGATIAIFLVEGENLAYQLAVMSLLGTMLVGLWLLRGVNDRWEGSGELGGGAGDSAPPAQRLTPATATIEPRT